MNKSQKIQAEINKIIEERKSEEYRKYGTVYSQHDASKKYLKLAEELGISEYLPANIGNSDIQAVLAAAQDNGSELGGFLATGEGDVVVSEASDLNQLLAETDEEIDESGYELTEEQQAEIEQQFQDMEIEWQVAQMEQEKYIEEMKAKQNY